MPDTNNGVGRERARVETAAVQRLRSSLAGALTRTDSWPEDRLAASRAGDNRQTASWVRDRQTGAKQGPQEGS
jgi:hypothetical protein